jgi:hypothetical protein
MIPARTPARQPIYFVDHDDPEHAAMWRRFDDPIMLNDQYAECLQYMGTVPLDQATPYVHEFRHRAVPGTNQRQYWRVPCSRGWTPTATTRSL